MNAHNVLIAHPRTEEEVNALEAVMKALKIKFETSVESFYNPNFVAKVLKSRKQAVTGETTQMELSDIWPA